MAPGFLAHQSFLPSRANLAPWEGVICPPWPGCPDVVGWGSSNHVNPQNPQFPGATSYPSMPAALAAHSLFASRRCGAQTASCPWKEEMVVSVGGVRGLAKHLLSLISKELWLWSWL